MIKINQNNNNTVYQYWHIFKNKVLISFYSSIVVPRIMLILAQTHLLIIEKINMTQRIQSNFYEELLTDLWLIAKNYIEYLLKYIDNKLSPIVNDIPINISLTKEKTIGLFIKFRERVEELKTSGEHHIHLLILEKYFKDLEDKIVMLENNKFRQDINSEKINSFLHFYKIYYDIVTSNLFQVIIIKALDHDFNIVNEMIELNFRNERNNNSSKLEVGIPKVVSFINRIRSQCLNPEHTILLLKYKSTDNFTEEMNEYFKIIYD